MAMRFEKRPMVSWNALDEIDRKRAALFWCFANDVDWPDIDRLLTNERAARFELEDGTHDVGSFWQFDDAGLLFAADSERILGEAVQYGFVCRDRALWRALGSATGAPETFDWSLPEDDDVDAEPVFWRPPELSGVMARILETKS